MDFLYSSSVVAPIHCIVPRARAGFNKFAASIEPGAEPAPTRVCISSINTIISGLFSNSLTRAFILSSNWPRYFVPATIAAMSNVTNLLPNNTGDVDFDDIRRASPSTIALFPTPGSPIRIGLFFFLLHNISVTRRISFSLPTTGSSFPSAAAFVISMLKLSSIGVVLPSLLDFVVVASPPLEDEPLPFSGKKSSSSSSSGIPIPFCGLFKSVLQNILFTIS